MSAQRFTRAQRLLRPAEFQRVFTATRHKPGPKQAPGQGRHRQANAGRSADRLLTVLWCKNDVGHARLGLAIAKRHILRAVARNRIKRQIRESFRNYQQELGSVDIVVLARPEALHADKAALRAALLTHWRAVKSSCATSSSG